MHISLVVLSVSISENLVIATAEEDVVADEALAVVLEADVVVEVSIVVGVEEDAAAEGLVIVADVEGPEEVEEAPQIVAASVTSKARR